MTCNNGKHPASVLAAGLILAVTFIVSPVLRSDVAAQKDEDGRAKSEVINIQNYFARVAEELKPTVVNISAVYVEKNAPQQYEFYFGSPFEDFFNEFFGESRPRQNPQRRAQPQRKFEGTGSGVIIDPDGYILTNEHVVRGADDIKVTLYNDKTYTGKVVGKDARTDLAVIRIKGAGKLPAAKLGNSDAIRVGDWAIAIGSPFGLQETVTSGIISAVRQSLPIEGREYRDLIQTDAAINRGNSGGPLCNIEGEVIGINTAIYAPTGVFSGIGFAIPSNNAREILSDLINKGKVVRGWLGVEVRPVDDVIARNFGLPDKKGVLINDVLQGSPAVKAGLQRGDIIREFDGKKIDDPRGLQNVVAQTEPSKKVKVTVVRSGKLMTLPLVTGEMPSEQEIAGRQQKEAEPGPDDTAQWEGMQITTLTGDIAREFNVPAGEKGCVVIRIDPSGTAAEMGIIPGDVIRSINKVPTPDVRQFSAAVKKVKLAEGVILDINRQGRLIYLSYRAQ